MFFFNKMFKSFINIVLVTSVVVVKSILQKPLKEKRVLVCVFHELEGVNALELQFQAAVSYQTPVQHG